MLDEQAVKAARLWIFAPPKDSGGRSVTAVVTLILDFRLARQAPPVAQPSAQPASPDAAPIDEQAVIEEFRRGALPPGTPGLGSVKVLRSAQPTYTSDAMRAKIEGTVKSAGTTP